MDGLRLPAPAKINLFLNILDRRSDGYHNLQTVFQLLDYCDWLQFSPLPREIEVTSDVPLENPDDNLVMRAARLLREATGCPLGAKITLDKHIPMGGGLGGGSTDAATVLIGLNQLWGLQLSVPELAAIGLRLGADVPVFVHGNSAWAEGIGERLQAIDLPAKWFIVVQPGCTVSTAEVFSHPDLTRNGTPITIAAFLGQGAFNACEPVVRKLYPKVDAACRFLGQWGPAGMTGTGSCVFLGLDSEGSAREVLAAVPSDWRAFVAEGLRRSPLHRLLEGSDEARWIGDSFV